MNPIAIALEHLRDLLDRRPEIQGAFVCGSCARNEQTETSDIDLRVLVSESGALPYARLGVDGWRHGIYIDAMLAPVSVYASAETVLGDPFLAPQVRDAIIIHDPLKVLDRVQRTVVKEFYALEWLDKRVDSVLGSIESRFSGLCRAIVSDDKIGIIGQAGLLMRGIVELPLTRSGMSPSCTRSLMQLGDLSPFLVSRMEVIEGAENASRSSNDVLLGILTEAAQLMDPERRGGFADYFLDTLRRMIDAGHDREAVHAGWVALGVQTAGFYRVADDEMKSHAALLAERWLRSVHGWGTSETATKTKLIRGLLEKIRRTIRSGPRPNH